MNVNIIVEVIFTLIYYETCKYNDANKNLFLIPLAFYDQ